MLQGGGPGGATRRLPAAPPRDVPLEQRLQQQREAVARLSAPPARLAPAPASARSAASTTGITAAAAASSTPSAAASTSQLLQRPAPQPSARGGAAAVIGAARAAAASTAPPPPLVPVPSRAVPASSGGEGSSAAAPRPGALGARPAVAAGGPMPGAIFRGGGADRRVLMSGGAGAGGTRPSPPMPAPTRPGSRGEEAPPPPPSGRSGSSSGARMPASGAGALPALPPGRAPTGAGAAVPGQGLSPHGFVRRERLRFALRDLAVSTTVGTGTFGRVCVAQHLPSKAWFALKILKKAEILAQRQLDHIRSEVSILSTVAHPFIVSMLGHQQDAARLYMLCEYVPGGELFSHLRREGQLPEASARFYAAEIVLAFEYLHSLNVLYRDLKPENLLLTARGHLKITDFGFAKVVADRTHSLCGTPEYLAPEIIQSAGHGKGVDWWALGILLFEMLVGFPPFYADTPNGIYQKILAGAIDMPSFLSPEVQDLIRRLLTNDRARRLGCLRGGSADVKAHPWFHVGGRALNWDTVYACGLPPPFVPTVRSPWDTSNFDAYPSSEGEAPPAPLSAADAALFAEIDAL